MSADNNGKYVSFDHATFWVGNAFQVNLFYHFWLVPFLYYFSNRLQVFIAPASVLNPSCTPVWKLDRVKLLAMS